jgi:hypothetical protein
MTLSKQLRAPLLGALIYALAAIVPATSAAQGPIAPPEELGFSLQKRFSVYGTHVGVENFAVPGAKETTTGPEVVGSIANGSGDLATVTVNNGKVSIGAVEAPGKYSGKVNLGSDPQGQTTKIIMEVRDNWLWATVALVCGLLLALLSELWLTRWRPRGQLRKKLDRLVARLDATAAQQTSRLEKARQTWAAPRIEGEKSLLSTVRGRIEAGLENAMSDDERKRFGPEGDEMAKVDKLVETYEALLGYAAQIAQGLAKFSARLDAGSSRPELERGALTERIDALLTAGPIENAAELTELEAEAKDIRTVLHEIAQLYESYRRLLEANPEADQATRKKIETGRRQLLSNSASSDDVTSQHGVYSDIAKGLFAGAAPSAVQVNVPALGSVSLAAPPAVHAELPALRTGLHAPTPAPVVSTVAENGTTWSRYFEFGNWAFAIISAAVVIASGLSALYFSNSTFGTFNNYLGMVLWGSTVQGGISLVRQLVPGAAKGLVSGK